MEAIEGSIKTTKTARYYQMGAIDGNTKRIWVVLHGYGQLASYFIKHFEAIAEAGDCVIAPEGLSRFYLDGKWDRVGATWMTKEDRLHEIEDYVEYLDRLFDTAMQNVPGSPQIVLLGFSQGTATAWRWAMKGKIRPHQMILWAGGVAADAMDKAAERFANCKLHFVLGDADEYVTIPLAEKQLQSIVAIHPSARLWTFSGNHKMDAATLQKIIDSF